MAGYVQIIELRTRRFAEVEALHERWLAETEGERTTISETLVQDRDQPGRYLVIVEFASPEDAQTNNDLPATARFAEDLGPLLEAPPAFQNLDLVRVDRT
jgi:quinol monooxygenase YgiN